MKVYIVFEKHGIGFPDTDRIIAVFIDKVKANLEFKRNLDNRYIRICEVVE